MTKDEFSHLFSQALRIACENVKARTGQMPFEPLKVELHASNIPGEIMDFGEALNQIYLGDSKFYKIIDVAIKDSSPGNSLAFVRVSGHLPDDFSKTWDPTNLGPFKQILAD